MTHDNEQPDNEPTPLAESIAIAFHDTYESLAPEFNWRTQERSRVEWAELPPENRALMLATVQALIDGGIIK